MFLVYHLRLHDYFLPVGTWVGRMAVMETILEGRMGCVSIMRIHSFALHTRVLCAPHSAMQWGLCTWRPHTFFSGKRRQTISCAGGTLACSEYAACESGCSHWFKSGRIYLRWAQPNFLSSFSVCPVRFVIAASLCPCASYLSSDWLPLQEPSKALQNDTPSILLSML